MRDFFISEGSPSTVMHKRKTLEFDHGGWLRRCDLTGLKLVEVHHPAGFERALHTHEHASFHFSVHGGCIEYEGRHVRESKLFTLSFQPSGHEHACRCFNEGMRSLSLEMGSDWMSRLRDYAVHLDQPGNFQSLQIQWLTARLRLELAVMEPTSPLVIEALALELAVEAARCQFKSAERHGPRWLCHAKEFLHAHYREAVGLPERTLIDAVMLTSMMGHALPSRAWLG